MPGLYLLVIGGTRFLGRHLAEAALARGHRLTLLHRGRSGPGLFPQAEHLIADRDGDLAVLDGRRFDAVLDTSAYVPRQVRALAARLGDRIGQYQFVSSVSAYAAFDPAGTAEDAPLATLADPQVETVDGSTYGGLKALCERAAAEAFGPRALVLRPGLIVGPFDPSGRFTWWVRRFATAAAGERIVAPGDPAGPVQLIDARDAAAFMLDRAEAAFASGPGLDPVDAGAADGPAAGAPERAGGPAVFNLTGPVEPLTMAGMIEALRATLAPAAVPAWVGEADLRAAGVQPWTELPVWLPAESAALHRIHIGRAVAAGFASRPLGETIADTAAWAAGAAEHGLKPGFGLAAEREAALLPPAGG